MINYLKDIKKETLIGQLPDIINSNNESIRNEFNWIFDSSLNRLTKSVYAPTGSVKAHFGEFVNLACEYITVKNADSLKTSIQSAVESVIADSFDPSTKQLTNHNILNHRFINSEFEESNYMHDADAIVYKTENNEYVTVKSALDTINPEEINRTLTILRTDVNQNTANINNASSQINVINTSVNKLSTSVNSINTSINSINIIVNKNTNDIANVSTRTASNIETLNSSVGTINSSVRNINSSISAINDSINSINDSVGSINNSITSINASISNISTAISNIKGIPYETYSGAMDLTISPNIYYAWTPKDDGDIEIIKANINSDPTYLEEYRIRVICGEWIEHIIFSGWDGLIWENEDDPTQDTANKIFEFTIIDNYASYKKYNRSIPPVPPVQEYTVSYNANGGTGTMEDPNSPYEAGSIVTTLTNTFTRTGYVFSGWNTAYDGSGSAYNEGETFTINANTTLWAQQGEPVVKPDDFEVIIDGADIYSLQDPDEDERMYPTYVDYLDDYEYIPMESIGENEYLTIPTISDTVCIIFPSDVEKNFETITLIDRSSGEPTDVSFNPNEPPSDELTYNNLFKCDASCIYTGTIGSLPDSSMQVYYVRDYKIQSTEIDNNINIEYISGYIVIINDIINFVDGILLDFEYNGELNYHYHIIQAKYPHITSMQLEMGSRDLTNLAILTDENYVTSEPLEYNDHIYPVPTIFNGNIELYNQRYLFEIQLTIGQPSEFNPDPDESIISSNDQEAIVFHINYTITGIRDLDNIIKDNISNGIQSQYDRTTVINDIIANITNWDYYNNYTEYCNFIIRKLDNIFEYCILFGLNTPGQFIGYDTDRTRNYEFIYNYYYNSGFSTLTEQNEEHYPRQTILLHSEPIEINGEPLLSEVLPCHVIMRWSKSMAEAHGYPTPIESGSDSEIHYGDNLQDFWDYSEYPTTNPGIIFNNTAIKQV